MSIYIRTSSKCILYNDLLYSQEGTLQGDSAGILQCSQFSGEVSGQR